MLMLQENKNKQLLTVSDKLRSRHKTLVWIEDRSLVYWFSSTKPTLSIRRSCEANYHHCKRNIFFGKAFVNSSRSKFLILRILYLDNITQISSWQQPG